MPLLVVVSAAQPRIHASGIGTTSVVSVAGSIFWNRIAGIAGPTLRPSVSLADSAQEAPIRNTSTSR
jgi:hypothetical protein